MGQATQTPAASSDGVAFDSTDPAFVRNPYPIYDELRRSGKRLRNETGAWLLLDHADVVAALRDRRLSSDPRNAERPAGMPEPPPGLDDFRVMLLCDPPDHTRLRRLAGHAFTPRAVEALRPRVEQLVDSMLDTAPEAGDVDIMSHIAFPLPVLVICDLLGVPPEDQASFKEWSTGIARLLDGITDPTVIGPALPSLVQLVQYLVDLIAERRSQPRDDLLSDLIAAEDGGTALSPNELIAMAVMLFVAGHETTTNLIGNGTLALLRHPDAYRALATNPQSVPSAVEELLRYDSPVQATVRAATEPLTVGPHDLRPGERILCVLAAANRDPQVFPDPHALHLDRNPVKHLAFGSGIHHCLGAPLARLEAHIYFRQLASRFPDLALAGDEPPYRDHYILRGLAALPVVTGIPAADATPPASSPPLP